MSEPVTLHRLATGVPGLDAILGGGLPEYAFNLVTGPPGSGKTTLAHQLMFALATPEQPALFFTALGEPPWKMLRYQQQFSFFALDKVGSSVHFIDLGTELAQGDFDQVLARITAEVKARSPAFVFVDSFRSVLAEVHRQDSNIGMRRFTQQLGTLLAGWQTTSFLIGEYSPQTDPHPVFTIADGILALDQSVQRNSMVRKIQVMKMRGQATSPGKHTCANRDPHPHGRAAARCHAGRRPARRLFAAGGRAIGLGQNHSGHRLFARRRAPGRGRGDRGV